MGRLSTTDSTYSTLAPNLHVPFLRHSYRAWGAAIALSAEMSPVLRGKYLSNTSTPIMWQVAGLLLQVSSLGQQHDLVISWRSPLPSATYSTPQNCKKPQAPHTNKTVNPSGSIEN